MLTIQPNFTQRLHSQVHFKAYDEESGNDDSSQDKELNLLRDDITDAMDGLKKYEDKVPPKLKKVGSALCLIGAGAVMGVGTKLGWNETGKLLKKVVNNSTVVKFRKNLGRFGEKISDSLKNLRDEHFAKTPFGKAVCELFKNLSETKPAMAVKNFFGKFKKVKSGAIADTTGDIVAFSTGVSTTVAGAVSENKKSKSKIDSNGNIYNDQVTVGSDNEIDFVDEADNYDDEADYDDED